jgi:competence ComEA-like helix-hairpin-helix protein
MKDIKSHLLGGLRMRGGIFYFLCLFVLMEGVRYNLFETKVEFASVSLSEDLELQCWIDSCKQIPKAFRKAWTYNPNYLSEEQAYRLGISNTAYRNIEQYRASGKYFDRLETFKTIGGLSDSLSEELKSRLKFPNTVNRIKYNKTKEVKSICLNEATPEELQRVRGIGPVLSVRIVKFREALGGFQVPEQLQDVYGVSPEVARRISDRFPIIKLPKVQKININEATAFELSKLTYLTYEMAQKLVVHRNQNGNFISVDQISSVLGLPRDKIGRIALYLAL